MFLTSGSEDVIKIINESLIGMEVEERVYVWSLWRCLACWFYLLRKGLFMIGKNVKLIVLFGSLGYLGASTLLLPDACPNPWCIEILCEQCLNATAVSSNPGSHTADSSTTARCIWDGSTCSAPAQLEDRCEVPQCPIVVFSCKEFASEKDCVGSSGWYPDYICYSPHILLEYECAWVSSSPFTPSGCERNVTSVSGGWCPTF